MHWKLGLLKTIIIKKKTYAQNPYLSDNSKVKEK